MEWDLKTSGTRACRITTGATVARPACEEPIAGDETRENAEEMVTDIAPLKRAV